MMLISGFADLWQQFPAATSAAAAALAGSLASAVLAYLSPPDAALDSRWLSALLDLLSAFGLP
jgi:hypothetical protein